MSKKIDQIRAKRGITNPSPLPSVNSGSRYNEPVNSVSDPYLQQGGYNDPNMFGGDEAFSPTS